MILLIPGGRFAPRKRPQTSRDELPLRPLVDVIALWSLLALGGLFLTLDAMELYAHFMMAVPIDAATKVLMLFMGGAAPFCLWFAFRFWERLKR